MTTLFTWLKQSVTALWNKMYTMTVYTNLDLANMIFIIIIIGLLLYLFKKLVINGR